MRSSLSQNVHMLVCVSVCSLFELPIKRIFVSDLNILVWKWSKIAEQKKIVFLADFALQNMVETTLPDGLETSGRRAYR